MAANIQFTRARPSRLGASELARQPDLNWRNPAVQSAMHEVMRFFPRKGADGFRVDVIWHQVKDDPYPDNLTNAQFVDD